MAHAFSVSVNIGGKLSPSLAGAVNAAKAQVNGLAASLTASASKFNAPFVAVSRHLAETSKRMETLQRKGRNLTLGVSAPTAWGAASLIRAANERAKAGNQLEAIGELPHGQRKEVETFADSIAAKYGDATGILRTFNELLKAGFDATAAKGSLPAILSGAAIAGDMTGAELGGYVSKIVTQYKLGMATLEDATASSRRITDNLVYGAVKTTASTKDMAEAYKFVGSAAAAAGASVEQTNAMIIALAKEGQLGSEAGVALRSAYVRMVKPTKGGLATLARLGLNYGDYVQGGKRNGAGVVAGLSAAGIDMTGREKDIDKVLATNDGSPEKQRKAIYDAVVAKVGAQSATDRETVLRAVDDAFALAGSKVDMTKLLTDLRGKGANQGDLANIFEGRQSVRMLALLKSDLNALLAQIVKETPGYAQGRFELANQGLPKVLLQLDAAWKSVRNSLFEVVASDITAGFERLAQGMKDLAASSPALLKTGVYLAAAAVAAGPLMFALGAIGRLLMVGMRGANLALMALLIPFRLLGAAAMVAVGRFSAMLIGLRMLTALGAGATLSVLAASLGRLALAPFLLIATGLRAVGTAMLFMVANPVGLIITALVAALVALGVWVSNNWAGIKEFFSAFGTGFMQGLGPAGDAIKSMATGLQSVGTWLSNLLGPLDESGAKWREWGSTLGGAVASGVRVVITAISSLIGFLGTVVTKAIAAGSAIRGMFSGAATAPAGGAKPAGIAGARALGGPVTYGKPYLVGERGPELFVPGQTGRVETNNTLRRLTADGAAAVAGSTNNTSTRGPVSFNPVFNISGDDPRGIGEQVRGEMRRFLAELESDQSGYLSD
ncbi:phage tail tape measure protein [Afipia sp. DC4300-2b1]|uniref:phage tail tape measure protein n=1 Tax=Afipia sp. DC4300-2b1 TaxID=2804672 RepID=UPI003CFB1903